MLGQQVGFRRDLDDLIDLARHTGAAGDPVIRDRLARAWTGLAVIRAYALATLDGKDPAEASILKILWSRWHRHLGELAMDVLGAAALTSSAGPGGRPPQTPPAGHDPGGRQTPPAGYDLERWHRLFLFSRAETIYGGSDEIQHEIIAHRALGLPR